MRDISYIKTTKQNGFFSYSRRWNRFPNWRVSNIGHIRQVNRKLNYNLHNELHEYDI